MKTLSLFSLLFVTYIISAQTTYIPNDNFEQALIDLGYDDVLDDWVLTSNISGVTSLDVPSRGISNLTGIEDFISLSELYCQSNQLTNLDVSQNTALTLLFYPFNQLTRLNVRNGNNTSISEM